MSTNNFNIKGLTAAQVLEARKKHGYNRLDYKKENVFWKALKGFAKDPMVLLLLVASSIYFISGKTGDGIFLVSALILISTISLYQDSRSRNALEKLKDFTQPKSKVIRNDTVEEINSEDLVVGDGVNDGPALKSAHIGIAMGKKGTEIAKQAASLILLKDDLSKMVDAVAMGRKIYANLKKAIQFIISIHIPIILTVFIPLALGWIYPNIFTPLHIIFLELVMGPTCSIVYENEPIEKNTMSQKPRPFTTTFFNWKELSTSILQGLMITLGTLFTYQFAVYQGYNEAITRTMVFTALVAANIFLTLVNRSFYYSIFITLTYKNNLVLIIISITIALTGLLIYVKPLTQFFQFEPLSLSQLPLSIGIGFLSVIWFELVKWRNRSKG